MTVKDYYQVLGLTPEAPTEEIRTAYRKLAKANHPDKHKGDPIYVEKFKDLQEAYDVLSNTTISWRAKIAITRKILKKNRQLIKNRINLLTITRNNRRKQNNPNNPNNLAPRKLRICIP